MPQAIEAEIPQPTREVLTLEEAAGYLRVSEADVIDLAARQELPGRKIGDQWRFLKQGLADWLLGPNGRDRLLRHAGKMKDDPDLEAMLKSIYESRGRSMTEGEE
jgi:excisionase family DNA binding protein